MTTKFDTQQRFVRVRRIRGDGFVEFDFAIGDPALYVELILPEPAFQEFCENNTVKLLDDEQAAQIDADRRVWREGDPSHPTVTKATR